MNLQVDRIQIRIGIPDGSCNGIACYCGYSALRDCLRQLAECSRRPTERAHENARGVRMFPLLTDYGPEMAGHPLHLYRWLQYGSSLLGLALVAMALVLWLRHAPAPAKAPLRRIGARERMLWLSAYVLPSLLIMAWEITRPGPGGVPAFSHGATLELIFSRGLQTVAASLLLVSVAIRARLAL